MPHIPIIRHPDLTRLSDMRLKLEFRYAFQQYCRAVDMLSNRGSQIYTLLPTGALPTWGLIEDLSIHADRLQAIREEIEYRKIP